MLASTDITDGMCDAIALHAIDSSFDKSPLYMEPMSFSPVVCQELVLSMAVWAAATIVWPCLFAGNLRSSNGTTVARGVLVGLRE